MAETRAFPDISFVDTNTEAITNSLIAAYEHISGKTLAPASPERLFVLWVADIIVQQRLMINHAAKQNVPRYATGEYLDSLAELFRKLERLPAKAATTTIRFYISEAQESAQLIPQGTRVTNIDGTVTFETVTDAYINPGDIYADVAAVCTVAGESGNGYVAGQLSTLVDVFPYFDRCENITTSEGGSDVETDSAFYARMRESEDTYSTAGAIGAYVYHAKTANSGIVDVTVTSPSAGEVNVYVLMAGGQLPGPEVISAVEAAVSADNVRPLTDNVSVLAPTEVNYDIDFTYYIPSDSSVSASAIEEAVADAVERYKAWQSAKMGRDINPSKLISMLMETGIKRVVLTAPVYTPLNSTQVAAVDSETITNGGYEDE